MLYRIINNFCYIDFDGMGQYEFVSYYDLQVKCKKWKIFSYWKTIKEFPCYEYAFLHLKTEITKTDPNAILENYSFKLMNEDNDE